MEPSKYHKMRLKSEAWKVNIDFSIGIRKICINSIETGDDLIPIDEGIDRIKFVTKEDLLQRFVLKKHECISEKF